MPCTASVDVTQVPYLAAAFGTLRWLRFPVGTSFNESAGHEWIRTVGSNFNGNVPPNSSLPTPECPDLPFNDERQDRENCIKNGGTAFDQPMGLPNFALCRSAPPGTDKWFVAIEGLSPDSPNASYSGD